jgi:ABC-2 type transport system permease protein
VFPPQVLKRCFLPSRKPALAWLLNKEWRELLASRAWWIFLTLMGPLAGVSFISAVHTYAEASGLGGTSAGVGEAFSPLVGIWAPTFSACELAAAFLLPFVAIRIFAGDRQSGALKLELQHPMPAFTRIAAKALILMAGWSLALLAPAIGVALWKSYGGSIYAPELTAVVLGHLLNAGLTIALASAAASTTEHPATAAIVTLAVTVGCWIIDFIAAIHGGRWERIAGYTPTAMVAEFQHGLVRLDSLLIALSLVLAGLFLAAVWIRSGIAVSKRVKESMIVAAGGTALLFACATADKSWDLSENRMNSFSRADEQALLKIHMPLHIEVHLAPEDPRRVDLERRTLSRLRRLLPKLRVEYVSATSIGLFEQASSHYGEIWYELGGRREMSRAVTPEGVLETIYALAGATPPDSTDQFSGHPLAVPPRGAAMVFYIIWPVLAAGAGLFVQRRLSWA